MKKLLVLFLLLCLSSAVLAFEPTTADENDPATNPDANACFIGGTLYGKCNTTDLDQDGTITPEEVQYMYIGGWYLIRFENEIISHEDFPETYSWLIALEAEAEIILPPVPSCSIGTTSFVQTAFGFPSTVRIPLSVINGADPNGSVGPYGYGFDWLYNPVSGNSLILVRGASSVALWFETGPLAGWFFGSNVTSTTCPTPTP